ncbi:unnamed protein product [Rotaria sp. Silwood2]|nr:unnamed protein product [Rotaria sp. Silwood2]
MIEIDQYLPNSLGLSFNLSNLNENLNLPNETIESIINKLMIDSWSSNISFSSYYITCAPISCTYEYMGRNDLFIVLTTIIGIFGDLSLGLKLATLIILRIIEKIINNVFVHGIRRTIKNIFAFDTKQQVINRLHLLLLLITLYEIFISSVFIPKTITVQIPNPSLSTYEYLSKHYSNSLQCSCSQISISYPSFLTIEPRFHYLCSS